MFACRSLRAIHILSNCQTEKAQAFRIKTQGIYRKYEGQEFITRKKKSILFDFVSTKASRISIKVTFF